ncbi:ATP-grasp ribosomal peptide maturase [Spinactinospora alkalitolerans]|uniref:ATP-grasp ribosomal peptide maturase n=1 Tax=Spinactinospora alkalitolerans TaxID=687207 RepID=A0A852TRU4_9ACTN|nr:ATP-grasp ribosomal peptide maturase [Spinactinospora alkalitolerans]NYE45572.1 ATP-grasp ribosomal peptide maturase [Spinactinospora alkalitolerans]
MTVLILTHWFDPTADWVVEELNRRRVPIFRCDVADFPMNMSMSATLDSTWIGTMRVGERSLDLDDISGIYYRRPRPFVFPGGMSEADRDWAQLEAKLGFLGTLAAIPRWLNHPSRIAHAEYKPVQLQTAVARGLRVPRTIITNDSEEARSFAETIGDVVYKPFSPRGVMGDDDRRRLIFTVKVRPEQLDDPGIGLTAHMVQEWIPHTHAVRMTVVDEACFAAAIHSESAKAEIDWRSDYDALSYRRIDVPERTRDAVLAFLRDLGLRFGALDFLVTERGDWVLLEINPNGQWAWIEEVASDIAAALADALEKGPSLA